MILRSKQLCSHNSYSYPRRFHYSNTGRRIHEHCWAKKIKCIFIESLFRQVTSNDIQQLGLFFSSSKFSQKILKICKTVYSKHFSKFNPQRRKKQKLTNRNNFWLNCVHCAVHNAHGHLELSFLIWQMSENLFLFSFHFNYTFFVFIFYRSNFFTKSKH